MAETTQPAPEEVEYSENQIAVHWREEEYYQPPEEFKAQANANDDSILGRFSPGNFPESFTEYADLLTWDQPWDTTLDTSNPPFWKWFTGGRLNASYNCVDRHAEARPDKDAIIWVGEPEDEAMVHITYGELLTRVSEFAAVLRGSRSGTLTLKWRFGDGQSFWESERPLRDTGSGQESWQVSLEALRRLLSNEGGAEPKGQHPAILIAKLSAVHAGGEFGCEKDALKPD
jgi:hypothetical protein